MRSSEPVRARAETLNDCQNYIGRFDEDDLLTYGFLASY